MTSSFRDDPYRRPNFATDGAIPSYFRRPQVPPIPPIFPTQPAPWPEPPSVSPPFPAPWPSQQQHEVDPSDRNPYNDPDYSPFLITENAPTDPSVSQGGLLGRLLAMLSDAGGVSQEDSSVTSGRDAVPSQESEDRPVRILARRIVR